MLATPYGLSLTTPRSSSDRLYSYADFQTRLIFATMSFQNFDSFPNQDAAAAAAAAGAPAQADTTMTGQADPAGAPFQGPAGDAAAAPGPQQGADGKTTLWYVSPFFAESP